MSRIQLPSLDLYDFPQPVGLWKRRGAADAYIQVALGGRVTEWPQPLLADSSGYNIWHYWAEGPSPHILWDDMRMNVGPDWDFKCANNGEHPLHRLIFRNHVTAAAQWISEAGWPVDATVDGDTFWHALAWNDNPDTFRALHDLLPLQMINERDNTGMTAAAIAVHRGGEAILKHWLFLGADPDIPDEHGRTVLHHVAQFGDISWFTEIQDMGASDTLKNDRGHTPVDVLRERMLHGTATDIEIMRVYWDRRFFQKTML